MATKVTGTQDLSGLAKFEGQLVVNGVSFGVRGSKAADAVKVINRHTPQTGVTASLDGEHRLVLTSEDAIVVDGDQQVLASLGVVGGETRPDVTEPYQGGRAPTRATTTPDLTPHSTAAPKASVTPGSAWVASPSGGTLTPKTS